MKPSVTPKAKRPDNRQAWKALESHYKKVGSLHLRDLFAEDPNRAERMSVDAAGLHLDYSKNRVTGALASRPGLPARCGQGRNRPARVPAGRA